MKRYLFFLLSIIILSFAGCEKATERIDNFLVEFATVLKPAEQISFQLDNNKTLIPTKLKSYSGKDGQRVFLNYTPLRGDTIKVNSVSDIFTGTVQVSDSVNILIKDPVKIQSVWVGGNYLNLILEIEFYEKTHTIGLFRDTQSSSINLHVAYSRNNDPPGYAKKLYASFSLSSIKSANGSPTSFQLHINTYNGERVLELEMK